MDKCRRELELQMKREGEKAVMDLGIHSLHPDLVKLIGRLKYRTSYGQTVLSHSLEAVSYTHLDVYKRQRYLLCAAGL